MPKINNHVCPTMPPEIIVEVDQHTTYLIRNGNIVPIKYCPWCAADTREGLDVEPS